MPPFFEKVSERKDQISILLGIDSDDICTVRTIFHD